MGYTLGNNTDHTLGNNHSRNVTGKSLEPLRAEQALHLKAS